MWKIYLLGPCKVKWHLISQNHHRATAEYHFARLKSYMRNHTLQLVWEQQPHDPTAH